METEKRGYPRVLANWRTTLVFENREVSTNLRNISQDGAYLRIREDDTHKIGRTDVGQVVQLRMEQADALVSQYAEIRRYLQDGGSTYVAVRFTVKPKASR